MLRRGDLEEEEDDDESSRLLGKGGEDSSKSLSGAKTAEDLRKESMKDLDSKRLWAGGLSYTALLVIMAEFSERCCYYAITAIFVVYMQTMLNYSASAINAVTQTFNFLGYTFVLLGGYVADRAWGRKFTIIVFGLIYFFSLILLCFSASPLGFSNFPYNPTWASWGLILSLVLIALGMGGIKSNVGPLMADQLGPDATNSMLETAFRYFYLAINFGALWGMLVAPLVKRIGPEFPAINSTTDVCASSADPYTGYYIAFSLFTGVFMFGMVFFMWGYGSYISYPAQGSLLSRCVSLIMRARRERLSAKAGFFALPPGGEHWLDWAKKSCGEHDMQMVDDLKQTLRTLLVFSFQPVYWMLYLQMTNTLVLQASMMYLPGGITPDQMAALDPIFLVFLIPLFDSCVFPYLRKSGHTLNAIQRMCIGYALVALSMFVASGLQYAIYNSGSFVNCSGQATFVIDSTKGGVNVFSQVPVYFLIAISEIFASITSLEIAYSEAPTNMKSIVMAYSLFQTALGALIGIILTPVVTEQNFAILFLSFGVAMAVFAIIFYAVFRDFYKGR